MGLQTHFTAGVKGGACLDHSRGDTAPQAAGVIHGDFGNVASSAPDHRAFGDYIQFKGEQGAKDAGKMRAEGKEYVVK